ncbi:hypothetical protein ES703_38075 [subsurface metagenome]
MSDKDKLNEVVTEHKKARKELDDKLNRAVENNQRRLRELEEQSSHPA